jgi:hypothetical protein
MTNWSETLPLTRESVAQHVGKCGGVLRVLCATRMGPDVFYVENCEDLCASLTALLSGVAYDHQLAHHLRQPGVGFRFFPSDNADERSQVEAIELHKWRPPCNPR